MFKECHFLSYRQISTLRGNEQIAIISISDPKYEAHLELKNFSVLSLNFSDVDPFRGDKCRPESVIFNSDHAQTIRYWAEALHDLKRELVLVVHCWAGLSRSAAVAWWASQEFGIPLITEFPSYRMNRLVLQELCSDMSAPEIPTCSLSFDELIKQGRSLDQDNSLLLLSKLNSK